MRIWKEQFDTRTGECRLPPDARILHVVDQYANGSITVWFECSGERSWYKLDRLCIVQTDSADVPDGAVYVGTTTCPLNGSVRHFYDRYPPLPVGLYRDPEAGK